MSGNAALAISDNAQIEIVATDIPGVFHGTERGVYNDIFDRLIEGYEGNIKLSPAPAKRALRLFLEEGADCYFISVHQLDSLIDNVPRKLIHTEAFNLLEANLFGREIEMLPQSLSELGKYRVATTFAIQDVLSRQNSEAASMNLMPVDSSVRALELLRAGRVQYAIVFGKDVLTAKGVQFLNDFERGILITQFHESLSCWADPKSKPLLEHFNARIKALKKEGYFKALLQQPY